MTSVPLKLIFAALLTLIVGVNVLAGQAPRDAEGSEPALLAWIATVLLLTGGIALIGQLAPQRDWRGILIDQRNRMSLSRLQLVLWTILVLSGLLTEGILNAVWGVAAPLKLDVPQQLWVLLGLSSASAVAAPMVLGAKGPQLNTKPAGEHAWRDIFSGDDNANADQVDFTKVQQFFLTVVLIAVYAIAIGNGLLVVAPGAGLIFPPIDSGFVGLMAVSQLAYISYKALPQEKTDA